MSDQLKEIEILLELKAESSDELINELWFLVRLGTDNLSESQYRMHKLIGKEIRARAKAHNL